VTTQLSEELTRSTLRTLVTLRHEPDPGSFWEKLAEQESGPQVRDAISQIVR
jgi:hypothetical protein